MKVLLIGLGSIAQKHLAALKSLRPDSEVYALRSGSSSEEVEEVKSIYDWKEVPSDLDFTMICNPTSEHFQTVSNSLVLNVPLFIEKPPFMEMRGVKDMINRSEEMGIRSYTAFNFRFHPVILWLRENLGVKRVLEVQAYCGSYLPDWRPGRDYREVYSAKSELGGGVHLDLIHELDYLLWIFGEPKALHAFRNRVSDLEIDTPDNAHYWLQYGKFNLSLILNYYRWDAKRQLEIVMENDTLTADLIKGVVTNANGETIFEDHRPVTDTYREQMKYFLEGLHSNEPYMNSLAESVRTLEYCLSHPE